MGRYDRIVGNALRRRAQRLLEPLTHRLTGGCSLLRNTRSTIEHSGFRIEAIEEDHLPAMPLLYRRVIRGVARPGG